MGTTANVKDSGPRSGRRRIAMAGALAAGALLVGAGTANAVSAVGTEGVPSRSSIATPVGEWTSPGRTLELRGDGTGTVGAWTSPISGTLVDIGAVPASSPSLVADVTAVHQYGLGALPGSLTPARGAIVTIDFSPDQSRATVSWSAGIKRLTSTMCKVSNAPGPAPVADGCSG